MKSGPNNSLLIAAQFFSEGSGGIAEVARMTTKSLAARFPTRALACQDREDFRFDNVHVRAFRQQPVALRGGVRARLDPSDPYRP